MFYSGVAGTDYSVYASVPETGFDCNVQEFPGIYSDTEADCQVPYLPLTNFISKASLYFIIVHNKIKSHTLHNLI